MVLEVRDDINKILTNNSSNGLGIIWVVLKTKKEKKMKVIRSKFFNISQLLERGWTRSKIDKWFQNPHALAKNPYYPTSGPPQKLYSIKKVKKVEKMVKRQSKGKECC